MADENSPTPAEVPATEIPRENQTPPPAPAPAPPPAATVVVNGTRREGEPIIAETAPETELENLREERDEDLTPAARRKLELRIAELEKENEDLKEIPAPPKPKKEKRVKNWSDPVFSDDE